MRCSTSCNIKERQITIMREHMAFEECQHQGDSMIYRVLWGEMGVSLMAQRVKCLPAMQETWVWSLGWEDSLEEKMATHSSIPVWKIPWRKELGWLQAMGLQKVRWDWMCRHRAETQCPIWLLDVSLYSSSEAGSPLPIDTQNRLLWPPVCPSIVTWRTENKKTG